MSQDYEKQDEMKRKLRELKKLEMKVWTNTHYLHKTSKLSNKDSQNIELVWNQFFDLKNENTKSAKYSISKLVLMNKDAFKDVLNDYFNCVYYRYYKDSGIEGNSLIDSELLKQLGLPINSDHADVKNKFRELVKAYHPDNGGTSDKFIELMEKYKDFKTDIK